MEESCRTGNNTQVPSRTWADQAKYSAPTCWARLGAPPRLPAAHASCAGAQTSLTSPGDHSLTTRSKQEAGERASTPNHQKTSMPDFHYLPQWHPVPLSTQERGRLPISDGQTTDTISPMLSPSERILFVTFLMFSHPTSARLFLEGLEGQWRQSAPSFPCHFNFSFCKLNSPGSFPHSQFDMFYGSFTLLVALFL